jgi:hypothetical protein
MRTLKLTLLALTSLVLVGCATPKYNYKAVAVDVSEPPLNVRVTKSIGEEMVKQGKLARVEVLSVEKSVKPHWGITVNPGTYNITGTDDEADYFDLGGSGEGAGYVDKSWAVDPLRALMVKKDTKAICAITIFGAAACSESETASYSKQARAVLLKDSIQQTLIYSGRIGNRIKLGYREFSRNYARPAFNNDVEYDLSVSKEVGYKGALIEVVEATNTHITYIVRKNFNDATFPSAPPTMDEPNKPQSPPARTI